MKCSPSLAAMAAILLNPSFALADLSVIPSQDQSAEQQAVDRIACHEWAAAETGWDPVRSVDDDLVRLYTFIQSLESTQEAAQQAEQRSRRDEGLPGMLRRAARAEILDDAVGAILGSGESRRRAAAADAVQQTAEQRIRLLETAAAKREAYLDATRLCFEGKGYTVGD